MNMMERARADVEKRPLKAPNCAEERCDDFGSECDKASNTKVIDLVT